jgi:hypothetical protein
MDMQKRILPGKAVVFAVGQERSYSEQARSRAFLDIVSQQEVVLVLEQHDRLMNTHLSRLVSEPGIAIELKRGGKLIIFRKKQTGILVAGEEIFPTFRPEGIFKF